MLPGGWRSAPGAAASTSVTETLHGLHGRGTREAHHQAMSGNEHGLLALAVLVFATLIAIIAAVVALVRSGRVPTFTAMRSRR